MKEVFPCGDGTCSVTATGADCICSAGSFGDRCENFVCNSKSCGLNGQEFVAYPFSGIDYCQCKSSVCYLSPYGLCVPMTSKEGAEFHLPTLPLVIHSHEM